MVHYLQENRGTSHTAPNLALRTKGPLHQTNV